MFATTKLLMHYGVTFSYIENCAIDSDILKKELADFLAAANVVKAFLALRIARISSRPKEFLSVMSMKRSFWKNTISKSYPGSRR